MQTLAGLPARGKTILFVSHSPEAVRLMCRRVLVLERGRLLFDGGVEEGLDFYAWLVSDHGRDAEVGCACFFRAFFTTL